MAAVGIAPRCLRLAIAVTLGVGCEGGRGEQSAPAPTSEGPCRRAFAEKLGVPFVQVCPGDLSGVVNAAFWIAAAPIGCGGGAHGTFPCPPVVALGPRPNGGAIPARAALLIDVTSAQRTCALRFGGRLPTATELAQARDALGVAAVVVVAVEQPPQLGFRPLAEWTTERPCLEPSTLGADCTRMTFPDGASTEVAWPSLRSCRAVPSPAAASLVMEVGDQCPAERTNEAPACLLGSPSLATHREAFALECRGLTTEEATHPDPAGTVAAFRCVVPESALVGTTFSP